MDLRETLQAAVAEHAEPAIAPVTEAAPVVATSEAAVSIDAPKPEEIKAPEEQKTAARDEQGRFAPKTAETPAKEGAEQQPPAETKLETAPPENKEPQTEAIRVPPSLPAAVKAKFANLDPDVQQAFGKLEESVQTAKAEWGRKGERLNRFDEIVGPHLDRWRIAGLDEYSGIQTLIAAQNVLERNPVDGLLHIARSYGVTPAHLAQAFGLSQTSAQQPGQVGQQPAILPPEFDRALQPLMQQVQTLQQELQQSKQTTEAQQQAEAQAEVDAFMSKPENMYFNDVRQDVAVLLQAGRAKTLQEAYDMAIWASPVVRPLLIEAQTSAARTEAEKAAEAKRVQETARLKAQAANHAGGSVTGAPAPGAQAPGRGSLGSSRDDLLAAMKEHGAQI